MFTEKMLSKTLKKTLATTLPVIALGGFLATATMVQVASAGNEVKQVANEVQAEPSQAISAEQRDNLKAQLLAEGKTDEEAEAQIEEMLKNAEIKK